MNSNSLNSRDINLSILLLGTQMAIGGAQRVLLDQARWLHERGHRVRVFFIYDKEGFHRKWQDVSDFPIHDLKAFQKDANIFRNWYWLFKGLLGLWQLIHREKFDVIETFTHDSNILGLPLAWMVGIPVRIATHHGTIDGFPRWRKIVHTWIVNRGMANVLVAVSDKTRQTALAEGVRAEHIEVIQNGIVPLVIEGVDKRKVRKEAGIGEGDPFLVSVGRLVYQKSHESLVAAMPAVLNEFPNTKLAVCGDGLLRSRLESQIRELRLSEHVILLGTTDHVARFLASADVFVLPSRWEGLPLALLEAMSVGLPVIATKVEGVEEVVLEGKHGLLVPVEDAEALAQAILQLLRDPRARHRMGLAAKQRLLEFYSVDRMGERYLALMHACLAR